jgi:hypothetical protein
MSCRLRQAELQRLMSLPVSFSFFAKEWSTWGSLTRALRPCFGPADAWQLKMRSHDWKISVFYQCVKDTHFRSRDQQQEAARQWGSATKALRTPASIDMNDPQKLMVAFLRDKFSMPDVVWSMPSAWLHPVEFDALTMRGSDSQWW